MCVCVSMCVGCWFCQSYTAMSGLGHMVRMVVVTVSGQWLCCCRVVGQNQEAKWHVTDF